MKKIISIITVFAIVINFTSCKKGGDDPLLSFGTRDALITNTWKLTKSTMSTTTVSLLGSDDRSYNFDGTTMVYKHNYYGALIENSYLYSYKLEIIKDNTFKREVVQDGDKVATNAFWYWHDSKKNKIGISFNNGNIYNIKRLSKKELVLEYFVTNVYTDEDGDETTTSSKETLTFSAE